MKVAPRQAPVTRRVLGIDPGTNVLGYAIVTETGKRRELVTLGTHKTPTGEAAEKLKSIYAFLSALIDLHAPTENYLPDLKKMKRSAQMRAFTAHDLLTHSAGLRGEYNNALFVDKPSADCLPEYIVQDTILIPPGHIQSYSNFGYGILGCLIAEVSGMSYGDYLREYIFAPAGMNDSGLYRDLKVNERMSDGFLTEGINVAEPSIQDLSAGDLVSTAADMQRFLMMMLQKGKIDGKQILPTAAWEKMHTDQIGELTLKAGNEFGYGLFFERSKAVSGAQIGTIREHGGDTRLFHTAMFYASEAGVGVTVMTNTEHGARAARRTAKNIFENYLQEVKGFDLTEKEKKETETTAAPGLTIDKLTGEYGVGIGAITLKKRGKRKFKAKTDFKSPNFKLKELQPGVYSVKVILLGLVPLKLKKTRFYFEQHGDDIYIKQQQSDAPSGKYVAKKRRNNYPVADWKKHTGDYRVLEARGVGWNMYPTTLRVKNGLIRLTMTDPLNGNTQELTFEAVSDTFAETNIVGRGVGEYIRVLDNGNLFYSGFELEKK